MGGAEGNDLTQPGGSFVAADVCHLDAIAAGAQFIFEAPRGAARPGRGRQGDRCHREHRRRLQADQRRHGASSWPPVTSPATRRCALTIALRPWTVPSVYTPVGANTGDGHKMIIWAGGQMQDRARSPPMLHPQRWADPSSNQLEGPFLYVNEKGERFFNEGTWVQPRSLQIMRNTADDCAYSIFDSSWGEDLMDSLPEGGGMFWDMFRYKGESDYQTTVDYYAQSLIDNEGLHLLQGRHPSRSWPRRSACPLTRSSPRSSATTSCAPRALTRTSARTPASCTRSTSLRSTPPRWAPCCSRSLVAPTSTPTSSASTSRVTPSKACTP